MEYGIICLLNSTSVRFYWFHWRQELEYRIIWVSFCQISTALFCWNLSPSQAHLFKVAMVMPCLWTKLTLLEKPKWLDHRRVTKQKAVIDGWNVKEDQLLWNLLGTNYAQEKSFQLDGSNPQLWDCSFWGSIKATWPQRRLYPQWSWAVVPIASETCWPF